MPPNPTTFTAGPTCSTNQKAQTIVLINPNLQDLLHHFTFLELKSLSNQTFKTTPINPTNTNKILFRTKRLRPRNRNSKTTTGGKKPEEDIEIKKTSMENSSARTNTTPDGKARRASLGYWILLCINYGSMFIGSIAASLMTRFYFVHGGSSRWVATWVQSSGFPILLIPIYIYPHFLSTQPPRPFSRFTWKLFFISIGVGLLTGISNFLVSWGISYLPVSTASLVQSCQLAFNLVLSAILVKQKLTFSNLNCVVLLTISSVLIALDSDHDRPNGVSRAQFFLGFVSILGAALLFALYLPIMEMVYRKISGYGMVMEMQLFIQIVATVFSTVGMLAGHGFHDMKKESMEVFDLGGARYWVTLAFTLVAWQLSFMGTAGIVYLTTSLTGGICMTALLPMNVIGGVVAYGDAFGGVKAVSTVLCLWGFLSYVYGQYRKNRMEEMKRKREMEMVESENVVGDGV